MTKTFGSRSILLALGLGAMLAAACFNESVLENEDCASNSDCWKTQECVRTQYQADNNADGFGWCRPEGDGCAAGEQPGCECLLEAGVRTCTPLSSGENLCPSSAEEDCLCVYPSFFDSTLESTAACPT